MHLIELALYLILLNFRLHLKELGHPIVYDTLYGSGETLSYPLEESFFSSFLTYFYTQESF